MNEAQVVISAKPVHFNEIAEIYNHYVRTSLATMDDEEKSRTWKNRIPAYSR